MLQVFISSIQSDYGDVREAVRRAVDSLEMRPLMAELAGAHAESPQRALLDLVARADIFLLIIGPRYSAPTEDEFNEANRLAKPILVLRQNGEIEPDQASFLERVAAGWSGGRLWGTFDDASDVALAAVKALTNVQSQRQDLAPVAQARAETLATQGGGTYQGSIARIAFVPLVSTLLLDAVALDQPGLADNVADLVRSHRLIDQSLGIKTNVTREGVTITQAGAYGNTAPLAFVGADGALGCAFEVGGTGAFGSMLVDPERLKAGIAGAGSLALALWAQIDEREDVQQVAVAVAILDAQNKVFGTPSNPNSLSMGSGMPPTVAVPNPPAVVRRAEAGSENLLERLVAEVKRVFADAGALAR